MVTCVLAVGALACEATFERQDMDVAVAPESSTQHVVFVLKPGPLLYGLSVMRCGSDRPTWAIGHSGGAGIAIPTRVVYGEVPPGYIVRTPAEPLRPGCYRAVVSGPRSTEFYVNPDGSVTTAHQGADTSEKR